jgi:hypothetical protein
MHHCLSAQLTSPGHWFSPRGSRAVPMHDMDHIRIHIADDHIRALIRIVECIYSKIDHTRGGHACALTHSRPSWPWIFFVIVRHLVPSQTKRWMLFLLYSSVTECRTNLIAHLHLHVKALKSTNTLYWYSSHSATVVTVKHWSHTRKI